MAFDPEQGCVRGVGDHKNSMAEFYRELANMRKEKEAVVPGDWADEAAIKIMADYVERGGDGSKILSVGGLANMIRQAYDSHGCIAEKRRTTEDPPPANSRQVGGDHYRKVDGEQHWDRQWRLYGPGYFVGCITKYIERYRNKDGIKDLEKARHFLDKLIELERGNVRPGDCPLTEDGKVVVGQVTEEMAQRWANLVESYQACPVSSTKAP